jgi:TonB family protein
MLFKDRSLNIAIIISASWHFVGMLCITPVLVSGILKPYSTTISFLGSILERVVAVPEKPLDLDRDYFMEHIQDMAHNGLDIVGLNQPEVIVKPVYPLLDKDEFVSHRYIGKKYTPELHLEKRYKRSIEFGNILVAGAAKNRMVLYQPDLPKVIVLNSHFNFGQQVIVRFRISRDGFVENLECALSSGMPEIDEAAMRYVRKWQFVPEGQKVEASIGMVRLVFD